jgi:hypothetical protein
VNSNYSKLKNPSGRLRLVLGRLLIQEGQIMKLAQIDITIPLNEKFTINNGGLVTSMLRMYEYQLKRTYETDSVKKVAIELTTDQRKENSTESMESVLIVSRSFDPETYNKANEFAQKLLILDVIQDCMLYLAGQRAWKKQPLVDAYDSCLDRNLEFTAIYKDKHFLSPDRKYFGALFYYWGNQRYEAYAIFFNRKKIEIQRKKLFECDASSVNSFEYVGWHIELPDTFGVTQTRPKKEYWATFEL